MQDSFQSGAVDALKLKMVRSSAETAALSAHEQGLVDTFKPSFVYPIFGQDELIFGYTGLEVQLYFASGSLKQYLHVEYARKFSETTTVKADDPEQILFEFIPPTYSKSTLEFDRVVELDASTFIPVGTRVGSYVKTKSKSGLGKSKGKGKAVPAQVLPERPWTATQVGEAAEDEVEFVAFSAKWDTPGFKDFHRRMQIFVLLYIEAAQYIDEEDDRWEFITLFEKRKSSYHFVGFVSFYSFFCWPDTKRLRLAQFVVLPPFQNQGHGTALYSLAYQHVLQRAEISELTVEDPSENFEDMRDKTDLYTLLSGGDFKGLSAPLTKSFTEEIRKKYKLADRQFYRVLEMILLLTLDYDKEDQVTAFRLMAKRRIYDFNKEMLAQIEPAERKEKLQETYESIVADYRRLLEKFE